MGMIRTRRSAGPVPSGADVPDTTRVLAQVAMGPHISLIEEAPVKGATRPNRAYSVQAILQPGVRLSVAASGCQRAAPLCHQARGGALVLAIVARYVASITAMQRICAAAASASMTSAGRCLARMREMRAAHFAMRRGRLAR